MANKASENKKNVSINHKDQLEKLQIEFEKLKEVSEVEIEKANFEAESWRKKYEEFAKIMEKRFNEKKSELEEKLVKEVNFEKERVAKQLKDSKISVLSDVFGEICESVLNISGRVLTLPDPSSPDLMNYSKGFQMIIENLKKIMTSNGLKIINPKIDDIFDPSKHDAISQVERKDAPADGVIIEIVSPQYCLNNKTVSYAKVKVAIKGQ